MVKQDLNIAALQTDLFWEQPEKNLHKLDAQIATVSASADIIILPEMFTTGFSMNASTITEQNDTIALNWMKEKAATKNAAICGSLAVKENDKFYNRLYWINPDGSAFHYDKRHLFSLADETLNFEKGEELLIVSYKCWNICPLVCYDLRFPVWSRNTLEKGLPKYDLLLYVANWPEKRIFAWQTLLMARAIENQSYVVGVNRVGNDGNDIAHSGDSMIIDPMGLVLQHATDEERILEAKLSAAHLNKVRSNLPFLNDADEFEIKK
jgi:predicted amidohydrolase